MSDPNRFNPFDVDRPLMMRCGCGGDHGAEHHDSQVPRQPRHHSAQAYSRDFIEATLVKALLPSERLAAPLPAGRGRKHGARCHRIAAADSVPCEAMAQEGGKGAERLSVGSESRLHRDHLRDATDHGRPARLLSRRKA